MSLITPGYTYKFQFDKRFGAFDGIYTIAKAYSWAEVIKDSLSIYEILYAPVNASQDDYNRDIVEFQDGVVYKLVSPVDGGEIYVPEKLIEGQPIFTVKEYQSLVLFIPLGIYDNADGVKYLISQVSEEIRSVLGITDKPTITSVRKTYLTDAEYEAIEDERKNNSKTTLNWFSETVRLRNENNKLKAQVKEYQKLLGMK